MSISVEITRRCGEDRLFPLPPQIPSLETKRAIFVSPEVGAAAFGPWEETTEGLRLSELRGHLDRFVIGGRISIAEDPYDKHRTAYLARLDPIRDESWQIRILDPKPAIRVFGHFALVDTFVALTWRWRRELEGPKSKTWRDEINRCKAEWRKLFPAYQPLKSEDINEYVSENFYVV